MADIVFGVSQINLYLARKMQQDSLLADLKVKGEITNYKKSATGSAFFSLKDEQSLLNCILFSDSKGADFEFSDGDCVVVSGRAGYYAKDGRLYFYASSIEKEGVGDLYLSFEETKRRLEKEGLFDSAHKKPLPYLPGRLGVVTSPAGAVMHDIITVANRRFPGVEIIVYPARVQGEGAEDELCAGLEFFNMERPVDVIIIGRGGGSFEELKAFNAEKLARAVYGSRIPVISAVGHEIDYSICDFAADMRAPTPSAAAEMCLPERRALAEAVEGLRLALAGALSSKIRALKAKTYELKRELLASSPAERMRLQGDMLKLLARNLDSSIESSLRDFASLAERLSVSLDALSPYNTLKRGYAIVRKGDEVVSSALGVAPGDKAVIIFSDGKVNAEIKGA